METIIFLIYTISLFAAAVCLWVKFDYENDRERWYALERKVNDLNKRLDEAEKRARRPAGIFDKNT